MKRRALIDADHLGDAIRPVSVVRDRIGREVAQGVVLGVCVPTLCEVESGLSRLGHSESHHRQLRALLSRIRVWPLEVDLPRHYAEIASDLRRRGRALSQIDIMLAALCRQMDLVLLTSDRDFEALPDLRVENWLG